MGAIDERIEIKAARRIEQIVEAFVADRGVGADAGARRPAARRVDDEALAADRRDRRDLDRVDARERRRRLPERGEEFSGPGAFDLDQHALGVVAHEAAESRRDAKP